VGSFAIGNRTSASCVPAGPVDQPRRPIFTFPIPPVGTATLAAYSPVECAPADAKPVSARAPLALSSRTKTPLALKGR
jgi:hypothetical protein